MLKKFVPFLLIAVLFCGFTVPVSAAPMYNDSFSETLFTESFENITTEDLSSIFKIVKDVVVGENSVKLEVVEDPANANNHVLKVSYPILGSGSDRAIISFADELKAKFTDWTKPVISMDFDLRHDDVVKDAEGNDFSFVYNKMFFGPRPTTSGNYTNVGEGGLTSDQYPGMMRTRFDGTVHQYRVYTGLWSSSCVGNYTQADDTWARLRVMHNGDGVSSGSTIAAYAYNELGESGSGNGFGMGNPGVSTHFFYPNDLYPFVIMVPSNAEFRSRGECLSFYVDNIVIWRAPASAVTGCAIHEETVINASTGEKLTNLERGINVRYTAKATALGNASVRHMLIYALYDKDTGKLINSSMKRTAQPTPYRGTRMLVHYPFAIPAEGNYTLKVFVWNENGGTTTCIPQMRVYELSTEDIPDGEISGEPVADS